MQLPRSLPCVPTPGRTRYLLPSQKCLSHQQGYSRNRPRARRLKFSVQPVKRGVSREYLKGDAAAARRITSCFMHRIQFPLKGEKKAKHKNQPSTEALQSILCLTRRKDPWHRLPDTETPSLGDAPVQPLPFPPPTLLVRWPGGAAMRNPHRV